MKQSKGFQAGFNWAQDRAKRFQLRLLARLAENLQYDSADWHQWFDSRKQDAYTAADRLFFALHPIHDGDRDAADAFWQGNVSDRFVRDLADGALQYLDALECLERDAKRNPQLKAHLKELKRVGTRPRVEIAGAFDSDAEATEFQQREIERIGTRAAGTGSLLN